MFYCSNISHVVTAFVNNIDILPVDSDPLGGYWPQVGHVKLFVHRMRMILSCLGMISRVRSK